MDLLKNFASLFSKGAANPGVFGFFSGSSMPKMKEKEFLLAYKSWVYACTNAIAERLADIEIQLKKRKGKTNDWQDVDDHPALDLIKRVNDHMSFYELIYHYGAMQELDGNEFWYLPKIGNEPVEIWPLDPTRVQVVKSAKEYIAGYVFTNEKGVKVPFAPDEIIHWKHFNPTDPYRGKGTVEAAAAEIDIDTSASEWQRNFFYNSAMPSAMLSTEGKLNTDQFDRIRANWDAKYKGVENAHRLAIFEQGLKYTSLEPTSREMQFTEGRKDIRDTILAIFRVPKVILGITEDVNFAAATATEYVFAKYVIKPKMTFFVTKLNEFYLPLFGLDPKQYKFDFVDPVPENIEQQIAVRESGIKNYYMTPNEARAQIGLEPVEGGDDLYIPTLYAPIANSDVPEGDAPEADPKAMRRLKLKKKLAKKKEYKIKVNVKQRAAKRSVYMAEQIAKSYKTIVGLNEKLKSMLLENLQTGKGIRAVFRKIKKETPEDTTANMVKILFDNYDDWIGLLYDATKDHMSSVMDTAGKDSVAEVGVDITFDLQNPRALDYLNEHAMENATSYSDTMKEDIALEVQQGVEQGQTIDEISSGIGAFFDDQGDYRAERLARTETADAYSQGSLEGYRQSGVVDRKEWLPDESACPICEANAEDGVIDLEDNFSSGDDAPPAHPNCECALQPVTKADEG